MVAEVRRALHRFLPGRNGDPKAAMAYTLLTVLSPAEGERQVATAIAEADQTYSSWINAGTVTQCNRVIHAIYYTLVENHVIKPGHPERERT
jgi:hypothetical protein